MYHPPYIGGQCLGSGIRLCLTKAAFIAHLLLPTAYLPSQTRYGLNPYTLNVKCAHAILNRMMYHMGHQNTAIATTKTKNESIWIYFRILGSKLTKIYVRISDTDPNQLKLLESHAQIPSTCMAMSLWHKAILLQIDGLVQEKRNPSALAMELRLSCTNPSTCSVLYVEHKSATYIGTEAFRAYHMLSVSHSMEFFANDMIF